jgi:hypothetical protein
MSLSESTRPYTPKKATSPCSATVGAAAASLPSVQTAFVCAAMVPTPSVVVE